MTNRDKRRAMLDRRAPAPRQGEAYRHGRTAAVRPAGTDRYEMPDGSRHRFDGKCHPDCPNVR